MSTTARTNVNRPQRKTLASQLDRLVRSILNPSASAQAEVVADLMATIGGNLTKCGGWTGSVQIVR